MHQVCDFSNLSKFATCFVPCFVRATEFPGSDIIFLGNIVAATEFPIATEFPVIPALPVYPKIFYVIIAQG